MTHKLKIRPQYFAAVEDGSKPFEIRRNDRPYNVGDTLLLREYQPPALGQSLADAGCTGRTCERRITYTLTGMGLQPGFIALGIAAIQ